FFLLTRRPRGSTLFPYTTLFRSVVYAGHAWSQTIPGRFKPNKEGVGLTLAEDGDIYRKGFFLGDGTGAGKGRQIAACILDNWLQDRKSTRLNSSHVEISYAVFCL